MSGPRSTLSPAVRLARKIADESVEEVSNVFDPEWDESRLYLFRKGVVDRITSAIEDALQDAWEEGNEHATEYLRGGGTFR